MIRSLSIHNYAIIDDLELNFSESLNIITGETGAGKSILLGALGLIRGQRAETKVLFDESKKCIVEACFDISAYNLQAFFEEQELEYQEQTLIRREILSSGKSRAFINDGLTTLSVLKLLSTQLLSVHGQFDTLDIQGTEKQLAIVDALAQNKEVLAEYKQNYHKYEKQKKELSALRSQEKKGDQDTDFWNFQLNELQELELENPKEQEELEQELKQLSSAEDIQRILGQAAAALLDDEQAITTLLLDLRQKIDSISDCHGKLPKLNERFEGLIYELEELAAEFQDIAEDTEHDGERLQEIENRLNTIYRLQKKHNVSSIEELINIQKELEQKLGGLEDLSERIAKLEAALDKQADMLWKLGAKLHKLRQAIVPSLQSDIQVLLAQLSMPHARLVVEIEAEAGLYPHGTDNLRFLFSANKGGRLEEIKSVASGGELSRLALCIQSLVADAITLPSLIFDEIDTGVSGEVAYQMGYILKKLSEQHQVISITHSPQIAARADLHFFVHKLIRADRTISAVRVLEEEEDRVNELAKMLSGNPPSASAKDNARELLLAR